MPKYLFKASYTTEGTKGLQKDGGTGRRNAIEKLVQAKGGHLESMYFAFGEDDVFLTVDLPNNETAAAIAVAVGAAGGATTKTVVLLTPEEIDRAVHQTVDYTPPGA